jgi:hypothetical protein
LDCLLWVIFSLYTSIHSLAASPPFLNYCLVLWSSANKYSFLTWINYLFTWIIFFCV